MIVVRCPSPVRDFLTSSKHPPRRMSTATTPFPEHRKPHCAGTRRQVRPASRRRPVPINLRIAFPNLPQSATDPHKAAAVRLSCRKCRSNRKVPNVDATRLGDASKWIAARRGSSQNAAEISARSHADGVALQCHLHVISIVNAAPPNSERWIQAMRADVSRWLMNTPGENE